MDLVLSPISICNEFQIPFLFPLAVEFPIFLLLIEIERDEVEKMQTAYSKPPGLCRRPGPGGQVFPRGSKINMKERKSFLLYDFFV